MTTEEANLVDALQKNPNDSKNLEQMMNTYQELLYWHIRRMVVTHADADDVLQNTFIKAWKGIAKFERRSSLKTWLYRIATNEALTFLAKKKKRPAIPLGGLDYDLNDVLRAEEGYDPEKAAWKLQEAIQTLPEKQKLVFNLRYFDEMPYSDMSEVLDTSVGALKASYHHAIKKIEAYINENAQE